MYAAVSDISYIAESFASWEKESGSVAKLCASNIRFGYCAILIIKARNNAQCLFACPSFLLRDSAYSEAIHFIRPGIGIQFTMSEAMTRSMHCHSIMISTTVVIVEAPSSKCNCENVVNGAP